MSNKTHDNMCVHCSRRDFVRKGLYGLGLMSAMPAFLGRTSDALAIEALIGDRERHPKRILVVAELSGGNDGLNTVIPYTDDEYYRSRPVLAIPQTRVRKINEQFGFHPSLEGFEQVYKDGHMAIIPGCGYPNPSLSHFSALEYWHTGVPNGAESRGWVGRFADAYSPKPQKNFIVNIAKSQSLAVRSKSQSPIVFSEPEKFDRNATQTQKDTLAQFNGYKPLNDDSTLDFVRRVSGNAADSSQFVKDACGRYQTPIDYGFTSQGLSRDLKRVAALINAGMQTRVYYVNFAGFDTHTNQLITQRQLLLYVGDAIRGFLADMKRIGRADDVAVMMFTEFGRRVKENASGGTDHGTSSPMYVFGHPVKGGVYGKHPSLTDLDDGNLRMTTDFRRVYATLIKEWMGLEDTKSVLNAEFPTLDLFA